MLWIIKKSFKLIRLENYNPKKMSQPINLNKLIVVLCVLVSILSEQVTAQIVIGSPNLGFSQACASESFNTYNTTFVFSPENGIDSSNQFIIEMSNPDVERLIVEKDQLLNSGLAIEAFGENAIIVHETPVLLGDFDVKSIILDILDELSNDGESKKLEEELTSILSRKACHGSIRSGRRLNQEEMNALLREMEITPYSGQCNHGRPTYIELKLSDIERLFGRT